MSTTTDSYGVRCRKQRERAGLSLSAARDLLRDTIPRRYVPSVKTLHRIEIGEVPEDKVDGLLIYGLARIYKCRVGDLSPLIAQEFDEVSDLVTSSLPWITTTPGQLDLFAAAA